MIIARIESLILGAGMDDALTRAVAYIEAGADGIMIHSCAPEPDEILEFAERFAGVPAARAAGRRPVDLQPRPRGRAEAAGVNVVIYANQLLRSAYPAMQATAQSILEHGRSLESDDELLPIGDVLRLIPGGP